MPANRFIKDPQARLDYSWDWLTDGWLDDGETIVSASVTVPAGLTKDSETNDGTGVTVWLSGGTADVDYMVTCQIITDSVPARTDERSITVMVRER